ncbi:MAG TPA: branched-chain amino acid ABC transporter permease, partial [Actinomycetota bacterium]|nr:branched-chain amino acid ABC transporter permease [Actinomycetota bacterium]
MKALFSGPRWRLALVLAVAGAVVPPVLARMGLMGDLFALNVGIGVCFAAAALSLNLLMGYAGQISLGHAALLGVGAFTSGILTARGPELAFMWGFLAGALVGAIFAFLLGLPALRLRGLYLAVVTIAFAFMVEESLFKWRPITGGSAGLEIPRPLAGDFYFSRNPDYLALILVLF